MRLKDRRKRNNKKSWKEEGKEPTPRYIKPKKTGTNNEGKLKTFVVVSTHCAERFVEMMPEFEYVEFSKVRGIILAMYRDGCIFGGQSGEEFLVLAKNRYTGREVVFACIMDESEEKGQIIILKTTLSVDHANGNIQQLEMKNPDVSLGDMM